MSERRLYNHAAGALLDASVSILESTVEDGRRTVVLRRPLAGLTPHAAALRLQPRQRLRRRRDRRHRQRPLVWAGPPRPKVDKSTGAVTLLPVGLAACVCPAPELPFGQAVGTLEYIDPLTNRSLDQVGFNNDCAPQPRMDTLAQHNPTCDLRTYSGGQIACHHEWVLLDADQPQPWPNQTLEYVLKFRFWVQEFDPAYHAQIYRTTSAHLSSTAAAPAARAASTAFRGLPLTFH